MAYLNGRLPDSVLAVIPGTRERVRADLLPQLVAAMSAFRAKFGRVLGITDGYRTYEEQVAVKAIKGKFAATPGKSNHGWGTALDLGSGVNSSFTSPEHLWLRANGPAFGLFNPWWAHDHNSSNGEDEPWHWEFSSGVVNVSNYQHIPGAVSGVPALDPLNPLDPLENPEDDQMKPMFLRRSDGLIVIAGPTGDPRVLEFVQWRIWEDLGYTITHELGYGEFNAIVASLGLQL